MASTRILHTLFGSLGVFWLLSVSFVAGDLQLFIINSKTVASCGENVTLQCQVEADDDIDIKNFFWIEKKEICEWTKESNVSDIKCESFASKTAKNFYTLRLFITNVQPKHNGTYHCKLRAKEGMKGGDAHLWVQNCVGNSATKVTTDMGTCTFKDVFPEPHVTWNKGVEDVTHLAVTKVTVNAAWLFTVVSSINLQSNHNNTDPYNCSLLMPIENELGHIMDQTVRILSLSRGHTATVRWLEFMLAMMLGIVII